MDNHTLSTSTGQPREQHAEDFGRTSPSTKSIRKRGKKACGRCRLRKVRCDLTIRATGSPCTNCRLDGVPCFCQPSTKRRGACQPKGELTTAIDSHGEIDASLPGAGGTPCHGREIGGTPQPVNQRVDNSSAASLSIGSNLAHVHQSSEHHDRTSLDITLPVDVQIRAFSLASPTHSGCYRIHLVLEHTASSPSSHWTSASQLEFGPSSSSSSSPEEYSWPPTPVSAGRECYSPQSMDPAWDSAAFEEYLRPEALGG